MKKLFVDDERVVPQGWDVARNYDDAISKLSSTNYDELSLDHDIASFNDSGREMTGYDVALWLANRKMTSNDYVPPIVKCHSANPAGRKNIQGVIDRYLT
jgi:hypothetical protein